MIIINFLCVGLFTLFNVYEYYICVPYMPGALRDQKRELDLLELELQMVVNLHVGTEN